MGRSAPYPIDHPYVETFYSWGHQFGGADRLVVMVAVKSGTIFNAETLDKVRDVHRAMARVPGVWASQVTSLARYMDQWERAHRRSWKGGRSEIQALRTAALSDWARCRMMVSRDERAALLTTSFFRDDLDAAAIYRAVRKIVGEHSDAKTSIHAVGRPMLRGEMLAGAGLLTE